jgi:hypothetical protein
MHILEFGRGKDKRKRKKRNSLLRKTAIVAGSAGLGTAGVLAASRGIRRRNVQLAKDAGETLKNDVYAEAKRKFAGQMASLSTFKGGKAEAAARTVGSRRVGEAKKALQKQFDVIDAFPKKIAKQDRAKYAGIGAGIGGGIGLMGVSVGSKEERQQAQRDRRNKAIKNRLNLK